MPVVVAKFGGTSVASIKRIRAVADIVASLHTNGIQVVVVVSAMAGETNRLLELARSADPEGNILRETDVIIATGEQITIGLLAMILQLRGIYAQSFTGPQAGLITDSVHGGARILRVETQALTQVLDAGGVAVVAGFQGRNEANSITTLGRGGSDTTAVAVAAALDAEECQIYTDVDGVYTADPRLVSHARRLESITFEEMLELASLGAKVLETRSVEHAGRYNVPLRVMSAFEPGPGTLISYEDEVDMEKPPVSGITSTRDEAKVTIRGIPDRVGIAASIFGPISDANINVDMIVQNVSEDGTTDLTFTLYRKDLPRSLLLLETLRSNLGAAQVIGDEGIVKVSAVGVGMRSHAGTAANMFSALAEEGINIQMISTSEIKISVIIEEKYLELAVRTLHDRFELGEATH